MSTSYRVGLDIGGTFTDFVLYDGARRRIALYKCLTTPHDPSVAALEGLAALTGEAGITLGDVSEIVHGTTLVTNAIIERRGARLGLLTTRGFRDSLEMGTEQRYDIYDLFLSFPAPLVPRRHRLEIGERLDRDGRVVAAFDPGEVREAARRLVEDGGQKQSRSAFLNSYANAAHGAGGARTDREGIPQPVRLALVRCGGGAARVSARGHDVRQCLCAAFDGPLSGKLRARAIRARLWRRAAADAFGRRPCFAGGGAQIPDPAARVRARRRRPCDRAVRQARRTAERDLVRHGRHDGKDLPGRGRPHRGRLADDGSGARASLKRGNPACRSRRR